MSYVARSQSHEAEWKLVSEKHPCPICESADGCHRDLEGAFACCGRRPSDWPLTTGAWLHRIESESESELEIEIESESDIDIDIESNRAGRFVASAHVASLAGLVENHDVRSPMRGSTS